MFTEKCRINVCISVCINVYISMCIYQCGYIGWVAHMISYQLPHSKHGALAEASKQVPEK